ncbi:hypothetical protein LEP1GSC043_2070 [Leptospira weilii str. Ecochallenge]|uniref:Uncharacterized protein n=1 Tax=Leptospira weilii str. Ecochallenge TaxID=1049986 RepID=N1UBC0_9LEPT|nr:hypothetical protein LEP1GSC043_2070 [Leptospira weilii str. Ecochallenge]
MRKIYLGYWFYKTIPPIDLREIKFSLENIGVKSLPDPKKTYNLNVYKVMIPKFPFKKYGTSYGKITQKSKHR